MSPPRSPSGARTAAPCQLSSRVEGSGCVEPDPDPALVPVTRTALLTRRFVRLRACRGHLKPATRRKREMTPAEKKDANYWDKRRKNNEAAKRSREKRRLSDLMIEGQLLALTEENAQLRAQVLSLQHRTSQSMEKSKAASACAASHASIASTLSLSPMRTHTPALFQAGLWGARMSGSASVMGMRQQEAPMYQFETMLPCFSSTRGGFNHPNHRNCGTQPLSGASVLSLREALGGGRSAEAELDVQREASSSDAPSQPPSYLPALLPTPDAPHHASTLSYPPQNWLVPHLNHSAVRNDLLLPWRSSYLAPPAVYPGLSLHVPERQAQDLGVETHIQRGFRSRFSSVPSGLS
ncbi:uncharacterized protein LOC103354200 [Stegastes partitus]|uniref:Uncharacterized protein LOC103354200 n=1 Tax=Stegastes partitus TaxID=144197 RepID=A0A9Y4JHC8_9TELE|nr:PREDICTED: uncharacterized protein LOC103354200 [Stegastes partitus]